MREFCSGGQKQGKINDGSLLTCFISERPIPVQVSGPPYQLSATLELLPTIAPPIQAQPASSKANIYLAILAIQQT